MKNLLLASSLVLIGGLAASRSAQAEIDPHVIYQKGTFNWTLGWPSNAKFNYHATAPDGTTAISWTPVTQGTGLARWSMWLPAGRFAPHQPQNNGTAAHLPADTKFFEMDVWPTLAGLDLTMSFYSVSGVYVGPDAPTEDVAIGPEPLRVNQTPLIPGQWNHVKVPLESLSVKAGDWVYKLGLQQQGSVPNQVCYLNNVMFTAI